MELRRLSRTSAEAGLNYSEEFNTPPPVQKNNKNLTRFGRRELTAETETFTSWR